MATVDPVTGGFATWEGDCKKPLLVPIFNARKKEFDLDANGFQLVKHGTKLIDFFDERIIISQYYPDVAQFMKETLGAHRVFAFDHVVRNSGVSMNYAVKEGQKIGGPALVVHGDYGMRGGPVRRDNFFKPARSDDAFKPLYGDRPLIPEEEKGDLLGRRFAIVNLWRSFTPEPCVDTPLTFCDAQTALKKDYVTIEFRYSDGITNETYLGGHSEGQRWYYYPALEREEGIMIKTYDSQGALFEDFATLPERLPSLPLVPATSVLHSAVKDPRLEGTDYPRRQSIEVRCIVFF